MIEPLTSALRTRRSAKLSYCPTSKMRKRAGFEKLLATSSRIPFQVLGFKFQELSTDYADYTDSNHTLGRSKIYRCSDFESYATISETAMDSVMPQAPVCRPASP